MESHDRHRPESDGADAFATVERGVPRRLGRRFWSRDIVTQLGESPDDS